MATSSFFKIITAVTALSVAPFAFADVKQVKPFEQDPMENLNREIFSFNKAIDTMYIKPISVVYDKMLPLPAQMSVGNFISNLGEIPVVANGILQGKFDQAIRDTFRFGINSTLGILGLFDVATDLGLAQHKEDFGKTLYAWGWKESDYFVIPILGPSTVRDAFGIAGNLFMSAPAYFKPKWRNRYFALTLINKRKDASEFEGVAGVAGVNYYNLVRSSYLQNREFQLTEGKVPMQNANGTNMLDEPPA